MLFRSDTGNVVLVGSFSKTVSPSLRLGYVIAPPAVAQAVANIKHLVDWHTPTQTQVALAKFMADGDLQRHIRRCHAVYAQRRDRLRSRFADDLARWFEPVPTTAGFHLSVLARRPLDMPTLLNLARRVGVGLYPLAPFHHFTPPRDGLLMGFGVIAAEDIDPALDRVRAVLEQMD